jgi:hypothetical protein
MGKALDLGVLGLGIVCAIFLLKGFPVGEPMSFADLYQWILKMLLAGTVIGFLVKKVVNVSSKADDIALREIKRFFKKGKRR